MKETIEKWICEFVLNYQNREDIKTKWQKPIVGFADAEDSYIKELKNIVADTHVMPKDVMNDASIVIAYYIPFTKEIAQSNNKGLLSSWQWALAYEETNKMINCINEYVINKLKEKGYMGAIAKESLTFDQKLLKSNWSHRHFAYAAGLGTFGINNMLITKKGCAGRYGTIVTNLDVIPDKKIQEEYCLYKKDKSCRVCMKNCPNGALTESTYDRNKCYELLRKNAEKYTDFGSSYVDETGKEPNSQGSEVCGKCITGSPCAFWNLA